MATKSFQEIAFETEKTLGNIGVFIVEEQCRRIDRTPDTLTEADEPLLIMNILSVSSSLTPPESWKKLERTFKRRISNIR